MLSIERRNSSGSSRARDEAQERALGIRVRDDHRRRDAAPVLQNDAAGFPVAHVDGCDRGLGQDFCSESPRRRRHRLRDGAHAAENVAVETLDLVLAAGQQMEEKAQGRSGRIGSAVFAVDVVREKECLDLLGLVVAVEEVAERAGQERDHAPGLGGRDAAEAAADAQRFEKPRPSPRSDVRGRLEKEGLEVAREALELVVDPHERLRVRGRELFELGDGALPLRPPRNGGAVRKRDQERRIAGHHLQAVPGEIEIADDLGPEHARDVGRRRRPAARSDLLGHTSAADDRAPLEHERREARPREIRRRRQAVVPAAHEDRVVGCAG